MNLRGSRTQRKALSSGRKLSSAPAKEEVGDDRSFALAGQLSFVHDGDNVRTRERTSRNDGVNYKAKCKALKARPNIDTAEPY